jgi:hypothetical protein
VLHSRSHKSTRLTCLLGGPHMRVRLTSATVHTPALEVSTSETTTVRSALTCLLLRSLSSERRLLSHHGPGIALPPTCGPAVRERMHPLRLGTITATPQRACAVGHMQWMANPALAKAARDRNLE